MPALGALLDDVAVAEHVLRDGLDEVAGSGAHRQPCLMRLTGARRPGGLGHASPSRLRRTAAGSCTPSKVCSVAGLTRCMSSVWSTLRKEPLDSAIPMSVTTTLIVTEKTLRVADEGPRVVVLEHCASVNLDDHGAQRAVVGILVGIHEGLNPLSYLRAEASRLACRCLRRG
jgi:hypothetical protein